MFCKEYAAALKVKIIKENMDMICNQIIAQYMWYECFSIKYAQVENLLKDSWKNLNLVHNRKMNL